MKMSEILTREASVDHLGAYVLGRGGDRVGRGPLKRGSAAVKGTELAKTQPLGSG